MKEFDLMLRQNSASTRELTTQAREGYSKDGKIFMEGKSDTPPNSQPTNFEAPQASRSGMKKPVSAERQTVARKAWEEANKGKTPTFEEEYVKREMIKRGLGPIMGGADAPGAEESPAPPVSPAGAEDAADKAVISDPAIVAEMEAMNNALDVGVQPSLNVFLDALNSISKLVGVNPAEKQIAIARIKKRLIEEKEIGERAQAKFQGKQDITYRFGLSLMKEEMDALMTTPMEWLNGQFDHVYALAEEGQELSSPLIQNTQNKISYAIDLINASNPEHLKSFIAESTVRLHLLQMRTAIGYKDLEQVKGAAGQLRAHGLLLGMALEQGKVGAMFNRFQDLLEGTRLWSNKRHHVMLEDALKVQKALIEEQLELAKNGKGGFDDLSNIAKKPEYQADFISATRDEEMTDLKIKRDEKTIGEALAGKLTDVERAEANKKLERLGRIKRIKKVNGDITRIVRTAYDVFVSSQRMGVIVSRGKYLLKDGGRYRSDPIGPLNVYNMEELLFGKFDMYSPEQEEFVDRIKLDIAETYLKEQKKIQGESGKELTRQQKIDLGKRLFRDLFAVPDFFSSGWRIEGVIQALEQRFEASTFQGKPYKELLNKEELKEYQQLKSDQGRKIFLAKKRAEDFALFMRLRLSGQDQLSLKDEKGNDKTRKTREGIWGKIKNYRPEEIIRLFRERKGDRVKALYDEMVGIDPELNLTVTEKEANRPESEDGGRGRDLTVYDKFKIKYGSIIGLLRQEGFDLKDGKGNQTPTQINLSDLTTEQKKMVDSIKGNGSGEMLAKLSKKMQEYIFNKKLVDDLLVDNEFADIYTRSIIIDDILLDKLEDEKFDSVDELGVSKLGYVPLSKMIGEAGAGGDTLARSWNDTGNAATAGNSLLEFIRDEDIEKKTGAAIKFATSAGSYNGLGARGQAECLRYTIGTFLNLSKVDMVWDIIGTTSLGRVSISDVQRIFGPQAKAMSRDELRGHLDHLRGYLSSSISKVREDMREKTKAFLESDLSEEYMEEAKKYSSEDDFKKYKIKEWGEELEKDEKKSHKFYNDLEDLLEVNAGDTAKRFGFRLLLYLLLSAIGETYMIGKSSFKDSK
ncbi:MAG: hypothetical protein Q7R31_01850 [Candidatus Levybacteria bacterium]|nr:hypothetical protein [Candidatus Levybacteria bacterium]